MDLEQTGVGRAASEYFSQIHGISWLLGSLLSLLFSTVMYKILIPPISCLAPFLFVHEGQQVDKNNIKRAIVALISGRYHQNCTWAV